MGYGTCSGCQKYFDDYVDFIEHSCVVKERERLKELEN